MVGAAERRATDEEIEEVSQSVGMLAYDTSYNLASRLLAMLLAERLYANRLESENRVLRGEERD